MKKIWKKVDWIILTALGSAVFALGFSLFLEPNNINAGGMYSPIDLETGKIACAACDKQRIVYERHPRSGCLLKGYQIPYWNKVMDICREAAHKVPQMGYIGWDVAITKDGPLFIEANNMPGHDAFPQMPLQAPDKIGILPVFQKYIKGL